MATPQSELCIRWQARCFSWGKLPHKLCAVDVGGTGCVHCGEWTTPGQGCLCRRVLDPKLPMLMAYHVGTHCSPFQPRCSVVVLPCDLGWLQPAEGGWPLGRRVPAVSQLASRRKSWDHRSLCHQLRGDVHSHLFKHVSSTSEVQSDFTITQRDSRDCYYGQVLSCPTTTTTTNTNTKTTTNTNTHANKNPPAPVGAKGRVFPEALATGSFS